MVTNAPMTLGLGGVLITTLMGSGSLHDFTQSGQEPIELPIVAFESGLLTRWSSEDVGSESTEPLDSECQFFNFTKAYTSEFCEPFAITRVPTSVTNTALSRAVNCAAKFDTECIVSSEIGFAVPTVFITDYKSVLGMRELIAPRVVDLWTGEYM